MKKEIEKTLMQLIDAKEAFNELNEKLVNLCEQNYEHCLGSWSGWDSLIEDMWLASKKDNFTKFDQVFTKFEQSINQAKKHYYSSRGK